jgi:uncharacterized protein
VIIGILTVELEIAGADSLKEKRKVLNRVKERVRNKFNVSISEIEGHDLWNYAVLGVVIATNEQKFANQVLCKVVDLVEQIRDCELADYAMEFSHR